MPKAGMFMQEREEMAAAMWPVHGSQVAQATRIPAMVLEGIARWVQAAKDTTGTATGVPAALVLGTVLEEALGEIP